MSTSKRKPAVACARPGQSASSLLYRPCNHPCVDIEEIRLDIPVRARSYSWNRLQSFGRFHAYFSAQFGAQKLAVPRQSMNHTLARSLVTQVIRSCSQNQSDGSRRPAPGISMAGPMPPVAGVSLPDITTLNHLYRVRTAGDTPVAPEARHALPCRQCSVRRLYLSACK